MDRRFEEVYRRLDRIIELERKIIGLLLSQDKAAKLVLTLGKPEPQEEK